MTDQERLDAVEHYGLCVASHSTFQHAGWENLWVCSYFVNDEQRVLMGEALRSVIDAAVMDIETTSQTKH